MHYKLSLVLIFLLGACSTTSPTKTEEALPIGDYADYQMSDNVESLKSDLPDGGFTYNVTIQEVTKHYAEVYGWYAETSLKIPLGWYGTESNQSSVFMLEDQKTRILLGFRSLEGKTFDELKNNYTDSYKAFYPDLTDEDIKQVTLSENQFYMEITHLANKEDTANGILNVITYNPDYPEYYYSLLLVTPEDTLEHYKGLVGLILRDSTTYWEKL